MWQKLLLAGLFALGVAHIAILVHAEGLHLGSQHAINDPGKVVFHVVLLPIAFWALTSQPLPVLRSALRSRPVLAVALMLLFGGLDIYVNYFDGYDSVCVRTATPLDIKPSDARSHLQNLYVALQNMHESLVSQNVRPQYLPACANQRDSELTSEAWPQSARDCYLSELRKYTHADGGRCNYWANASWENVWGVGLSMVGTAIALIVPWILFLHILMRKALDDSTFNILAVVSALLWIWIPLRMYSEWYLNFGYLDFANYPLIYVAAVFAGAVAVLLMVSRDKSKDVVKIWGALSAVLTVAMAFISKLQPAWVAAVATAFYRIEPPFRILIYFILVTVVFLIAYDVQRKRDAASVTELS